MRPIIKKIQELDKNSVFSLLSDIYNSNDSMSETFEQKFPDPDLCYSYFSDLDKRIGSIVFFSKNEGKLSGFLVVKPRVQEKIKHWLFRSDHATLFG